MTSEIAPFVHSVHLVWKHDQFGEPDYLVRHAKDHFGDGWSHVPEPTKAKVVEEFGSVWAACEHYANEDALRLQSFRAEDWWFETCRAVAEIRYEVSPGTFRIEHLSSSSLSGIESDSNLEYKREVESEQLAELAQHLGRFGIASSTTEDLVRLSLQDIPQNSCGDFVDH